MFRSVSRRYWLVASLLWAATSVSAHHSAAAEFDTSKPLTLHGKVTKISWMNPHVFFWMDAPGPNGKTVNWVLESAAPNYLMRLGWTKASVKVGDTITVHAFQAKDVPNGAKTDAITLPDGRVVTTGRLDDGVWKPR